MREPVAVQPHAQHHAPGLALVKHVAAQVDDVAQLLPPKSGERRRCRRRLAAEHADAVAVEPGHEQAPGMAGLRGQMGDHLRAAGRVRAADRSHAGHRQRAPQEPLVDEHG
ncbi:hypothetical protein [Burkholderia glumae]|uniref:hypothetical protein n=1 Tax=Burkholderia glumae TaxID=337 RepID=UPI002150D145|nr:hypothetical protein [Burkholderia glumae]